MKIEIFVESGGIVLCCRVCGKYIKHLKNSETVHTLQQYLAEHGSEYDVCDHQEEKKRSE